MFTAYSIKRSYASRMHKTAIEWARVHIGECPNCNFGFGQPNQHKTESAITQWFGPYATLAEAVAKMNSFGLSAQQAKLCSTCKPR